MIIQVIVTSLDGCVMEFNSTSNAKSYLRGLDLFPKSNVLWGNKHFTAHLREITCRTMSEEESLKMQFRFGLLASLGPQPWLLEILTELCSHWDHPTLGDTMKKAARIDVVKLVKSIAKAVIEGMKNRN